MRTHLQTIKKQKGDKSTMTVIKKLPQVGRTTRVIPSSDTTTFSGITRKPFILQEIGTREDAETYRALRKLFQMNKTYTSTLLNELDLDALQDLLEKQVFGNRDVVCSRAKKTGAPKKNKADERRSVRRVKMWDPMV